jgi:hypothetical protein
MDGCCCVDKWVNSDVTLERLKVFSILRRSSMPERYLIERRVLDKCVCVLQ